MALGREEAQKRALVVIDQWPELAWLDQYDKSGLASMMVKALIDGNIDGYDFEMASRFDKVAVEAQSSAFKNKPFTEPSEEGRFTVSARMLAGDVLRAGIKAGIVQAVDDRARAFLALHGSAGHDDTADTLR